MIKFNNSNQLTFNRQHTLGSHEEQPLLFSISKPDFMLKVQNTPLLWVVILIAFIGFSTNEVHAQPDSIYKGDTVRVTAPNFLDTRIVGKFIGLRNDSLQVHTYKQDFFIPLRRITKLEVAMGKECNTEKGLIIGALVGGLGLGIIAAIAVSDKQGVWFFPTPSQAFLGVFLFGYLIGGLTGAIIGSVIEPTRWVKVPLKGLSVGERKMTLVLKTDEPQRKPMQPPGAPVQWWSFSFSLGTTSSGPAKDIEKAMIRDGFDETLPGGWFWGSVEHPVSHTGLEGIGFPWTIQISYAINQRFDGVLLISHTPIGKTVGYRADPEIHLSVYYYSTVISPLFLYKPFRILYIGLGPALFINKIEQESGGKLIYCKQKSHFGALLQASLQYPQKKLLFLQCNVQYRYMGKATFGPFKRTSLAQLYSFEANFSHIFIGFGFGIRL